MYKFREYQDKAYKDIIRHLKEKNHFASAAVLPTGAGKSLVIAKLAYDYKEPLVILQPSKELLEQNYEKFLNYGGEGSKCSASLDIEEVSRITYGTIGTIKKFWKKFRAMGCRTLIIDECHLHSKKTSQLSSFIKKVGITKVIGLTATPVNLYSTREKGTIVEVLPHAPKNLFTKIIHVTQVSEMTDNGYWTPLEYVDRNIDTSMLELNTSGTDFSEDSMIRAYEENSLKERIIEEYQDLREQGKKHILIFVPNIESGENIIKECPELGLIHSKIPKKERKPLIDSFKSGEIHGMVNVNILATGFDFPEIDAIIMARPTSSFVIYTQQVGRAVRIHPDKKVAKIIDLSGNYKKFGPVEDISVEFFRGKWRIYSKDTLLTGYPLGDYKVYRGFEDKDVKSKYRMYFGKHKDKTLDKIPMSYLMWMLTNPDFKFYGEKGSILKHKIIEFIYEKTGYRPI